jgi:ATP-dependent Clp protease ATP-binding subunit ClpA
LIAQLTVDDLVRTGVLERFDDDALGCLRRAQTRAGRLGHDAVDSGDLLMAVLDDPAGLADTVIRALDADPSDIRAALGQEPDDDRSTALVQPPIGQDVRRAIDGAVAEAHGHGVAAAHLFLAILRTPGTRAGQVLTTHGVTRPAALAQILRLAGRSTGDPT